MTHQAYTITQVLYNFINISSLYLILEDLEMILYDFKLFFSTF